MDGPIQLNLEGKVKMFLFHWRKSILGFIKRKNISIDATRKLYYAGAQKVLAVIIEMDAIKKMTPAEQKKSAVTKQKRYLEKNREKVNARRREHYRKNKERINAKRREQYAQRSKQDTKSYHNWEK